MAKKDAVKGLKTDMDKEFDKVVEQTGRVCKALRRTLERECTTKENGYDIALAFYSLARFSGEFLEHTRHELGCDVMEPFNNAMNTVVQVLREVDNELN